MCSCGSVPCRFGAAPHPFMHAQSITLTPERFACMHLLSAYYIVRMGFSMQLAKKEHLLLHLNHSGRSSDGGRGRKSALHLHPQAMALEEILG